MNNEINYVSPFKKFVITIGNLPTAYLESMSYYEAITFLVNYLSNNVIPALNNNGLVVEELQAKFTELKKYVDDYFENLDVQEEINTKLDEMASDGTLAEIIEDYATIPELTNRVQTLEDNELTEMIVIGDSFSSRTYLDSKYKLWCQIVADSLNLNLRNYADPGSGFINPGDERNKTFAQQIEEAYADSSFNNDKVKYLFVMGGLNDLRYASTNNIATFTTAYNQIWITARNRYPHAKIIYLGTPSFENLEQKVMSDNQTITQLYVDNYIKHCDQFMNKQISCIDMTLFYTGMSSYFGDGIGSHPNYKAHRDLSTAVLNGLNSSSNAFVHLVTATPQIDTQSQSTWTSAATVVGENIYQLRITDKEVKMYLSTSLTRNNNTLNLCILDLPFNMIFPYSSIDGNMYVPQNNIGNHFWFVSTHTTDGCQGTGIIPIIHNLGYKYLTVYCKWLDSTALIIDLNYKINFNL